MKLPTEMHKEQFEKFLEDIVSRMRAGVYETIDNEGQVTFGSIDGTTSEYFDTIDYNLSVTISHTGKEGIEAIEKITSDEARFT